MTFAEYAIVRRNNLSSFWTIEDIVYGVLGPTLTAPCNHAIDNHFKQLNASYNDALKSVVTKLSPHLKNFHIVPPKDFEDLFLQIERIIGSIRGIGKLAIYDISLRIGCGLTPKVIPLKYVYTHGNKVEESAKILLPNVKIINHRIDSSLFNQIIPHYSAMEIEHILCCYHEKIISAKKFDLSWLRNIP